MNRFINIIGKILISVACFAAFLAYFISREDPETGIIYDGFGRQLNEKSFFVSTILGLGNDMWAGWSWFFIDALIGWALVGIGWYAIKHSTSKQ